jgi:ppGpp synthetase/RelA/SpoT-type nucleotidyltranferase
MTGVGHLPFSGNEIKRLGQRLRDGHHSSEDQEMLDSLRAAYDPLLLEMSHRLSQIFNHAGLHYVLAGRSKRTKSIIRKLQRARNHGMDLSRLGDFIGLRAIISSLADQDEALSLINKNLSSKKVIDHRKGGKLYRSLHVLVNEGVQLIEIQLRTPAQHTWAVESEIFGEQVKEETFLYHKPEVKSYLEELSVVCTAIDEGKPINEEDYFGAPYFEERRPITGLLTRINSALSTTISSEQGGTHDDTYVVVFDIELQSLLHKTRFRFWDRERALESYRKFCSTLSDTRYEVLIFNTSSEDILETTHPRFFM